MTDHEFGDQHTELKLSIVEKYLHFFTTALRNKFPQLWYIDAFAGTGYRTIRHEAVPANLIDAGEPERLERRRGSAKIAIDVTPRFDFLVFIENKPSYVRALEDLRARHPDRRIAVVKNDANDVGGYCEDPSNRCVVLVFASRLLPSSNTRPRRFG